MKLAIEDYITFGVNSLSFLSSLIVYSKKNLPLYIRLFPLFILAQIVSGYLLIWEAWLFRSNQDLYNLWSILVFTFFLFVLSQIGYSSKMKRITFSAACFYPTVAIINIWFQGVKKFSTLNFDLGSILIIVFVSGYYYELYRFPRYTKLLAQPNFWICTGLLFFYATTFPVFAVVNFVTDFPRAFLDAMGLILYIAYDALCLFFTIAFICVFRKNNAITLGNT